MFNRFVKLSLLSSALLGIASQAWAASIVKIDNLVSTLTEEAWTISLNGKATSTPKLTYDEKKKTLTLTFARDSIDRKKIVFPYNVSNSVFTHVDYKSTSRLAKGKPTIYNQVVFTLDKPLNSYKIFPEGNGYRLTIGYANKPTFKPLKVAVDAGHGGTDPGAIGMSYGTREKDVTIRIASKLYKLLALDKNFHVMLTRVGDQYVAVEQRPKLAAEGQSDIFISIHADSALNRRAIGASVWVLNESRKIRESKSILVNPDNAPLRTGDDFEKLIKSKNAAGSDVVDITYTRSKEQALELARYVIGNFGKFANLSRKSPVEKSLGAIKAPEIPSILVETGFLSNKNEELKLKTDKYQTQVANAIYEALKSYRKNNLHFYQSYTEVAAVVITDDKSALKSRTIARAGAGKRIIGTKSYTIQPGDYWYKIARDHEVTPKELLAVNPGMTLKSTLIAGKSIKVPEWEEAALPELASKVNTGKTTTYVVKAGDILSGIAYNHHVSIQDILKANPSVKDPSKIRVGQKLKIPTVEMVADDNSDNTEAVTKLVASDTIHRVEKGETLSAIARLYQVDVDDIKTVNKLSNNTIYVGQRIAIPQTVVVRQKVGTKVEDEQINVEQDVKLTEKATDDTTANATSPTSKTTTKTTNKTTTTVNKTPLSQQKFHVVVKGENFSIIAEKYGLTLTQLLRGNQRLLNGRTTAWEGDKLRVDKGIIEEFAQQPGFRDLEKVEKTEKVETKGTTSSQTTNKASSNATNKDTNKASNKASSTSKNSASTSSTKPNNPKIITHVVKKGEGIIVISQKYGMSVEQLMKLNNLKKQTLLIGQKLKVYAPK